MTARPHHPAPTCAACRSRPPTGRLGLRLGQCRLRQDLCAGAARDQPAAARRRSGARSSASPSPRPPPPIWRTRCSSGWRAGPRSTTPRSTRQIARSTGRKPDAEQRARARRLFASALETPGGLKVQTIHAFCTRLLHQFPFEANVAARFTVLDEAATTQLLDQLTLDVLLEAAAKPDGALGQALATAIVVAADQTFKDVVGDAIRERDAIDAWIEARRQRRQGDGANCRRPSASIPNDTLESVEQEFFSHSLIPAAEWPALIEILRRRLDQPTRSTSPRSPPRKAAAGRERIDELSEIFCTAEREPRERIVTNKLAEDASRLGRAAARRAGPRLQAAASASARSPRATAPARWSPSRRDVIARYRARKRAPRAARLRRPDRQDARAVRALVRRLGALQARSRHRPRADRRGAGHQPEAVEHRAHHRLRIHRPAARAPTRGARCSRSATRSSRSSRSRARRRAPSTRCGASSHGQFDTPEQGWRYLRFHHSFRSGANVLGGVDRVFARAGNLRQRHHRRRPACRRT